MNFVDTAITLLRESGRPMAVQELCDLALDRGLLDKPGTNPLRSMKTRLTVELKKGKTSRLLRDGDEAWKLSNGVAASETADAGVAKNAKTKKPRAPSRAKAATKKPKAVATATAPAKAKTATKKPKAATKKPKAVATATAPAKAKTATKKPKAATKKPKAEATKLKAAATKLKAAATKPKTEATAKKAEATAKKAEATAKKAEATAKKAAKAKESASKAAKPKRKPKAVTEPAPSGELEDAPAGKTRRSRKSPSKQVTGDSGEVSVTEIDVDPPIKLTAEEEALVALYGSPEGTRSAAELNEYRDELTKDEDRPMLPEIRAERRPHRARERPRKRRSRTDRGERPERSDRSERSSRSRSDGSTRRRTSSSTPRDISGALIELVDADSSPREQLTAAAYAVLATLPAGQSMPVRQLTQALIRQGQLEGRADTLWRMVKGTLLVSEQRRNTRGLPPLVRYRGKDLFSAGFVPGRSAVDLAEAALAKAAENYAAAVEREMQSRLSQLAPQMLERIAYVYLQSTGWKEIAWIKRVERSSYALATAPGAVDQTMIAVRGGPAEVDRRGVGELRAGLYAKDLDSGLLMSPCDLSEEAHTELAKEGAHVRLVCGTDFIGELVAREVGVSWRHQQLPKIDQRFWDALLS